MQHCLTCCFAARVWVAERIVVIPASPPPLSYRPNVGIALFNAAGLVFAGRSQGDGPETVLPGCEWQMPQGGIDPGEDLVAAARRELLEETSIADATFLAATDNWWPYDFPPYAGDWHPLCAYRGQTQKWVALRFTGKESIINVTSPTGGVKPEFSAWGWLELASLAARAMPHKRANYQRVAAAFGRFTAA